MTTRNQYLQDTAGNCTQELTMDAVACTKPAQAQARQTLAW